MSLAQRISQVVEAGNCTGCGGCASLSADVGMELDSAGFSRPVVRSGSSETGDAQPARPALVTDFESICPGVAIVAPPLAGGTRHRTLGRYVSAWTAWAADPDQRHAGSSGGVLTALSAWLIESGAANSVTSSGRSASEPTRTVALNLRTKEEVLASAGSRYAPVGNAELFRADDPSGVFVGKPCEVYSSRRLAERTGAAEQPILLSFFCAGVPSQSATDGLITALGMDPAEVAGLRYRGNGWPGDFVATDATGRTVSTSYEESWGRHLGPQVQDRCKICPDGTGEFADVAVGDFWRSDAAGFPVFQDSAGSSVAIARTPRGHQLLLDAQQAGVLTLGPIRLDDVAAVQPLQTKRRELLFGRMVGRRWAGLHNPRYRGFNSWSMALARPAATITAARGSFARARRGAARSARRPGATD